MNNVKIGDYIKIINTTPFDEAVGILVGNVERVTGVLGDMVFVSSGFGSECNVSPKQYTILSEMEVKFHFENIELFKSKRRLVADIVSTVEESAYQDSEGAIEVLSQAKSYLDDLIELEREILIRESKIKDEHY